MTNGSLYANGNRVFPPSLSMQLHAPRYESASDTLMNQTDVRLAYSLQARPLSAQEVGATSNIVRVSVELLDMNGMAVTDDAVTIDIHAGKDGQRHLTRIHVDPATGIAGGRLNDAPPDDESDSSRTYKHSPFWTPFSHPPPLPSHGPHRGPHRPHPHHSPHGHDHTYVGLMRPVVLPALFGAIAGIMACVAGYVLGHFLTALWRRLNRQHSKDSKRTRRSRPLDVEDGDEVEKSNLIAPETAVNESDPKHA